MNESESHRFHTTRWSLVRDVRNTDTVVREAALENLLSLYRPALQSHLQRRHRLTSHDSEECVQDFIVEKVLISDLLARADADRGRLRSLLAKSLDNFVHTWRRRQKRDAQSLHSSFEPADERADSEPFDTAWARTLLIVAIQRMRDECDQMTCLDQWGLLKHRLLIPIFLNQEPPSMDSLAQRYGLESSAVASNKLITAKRRLARIVRQLIRESVDEESQVDEEIAELFQALRADPKAFTTETHLDAQGWAMILASADGERLSQLLDVTRNPA